MIVPRWTRLFVLRQHVDVRCLRHTRERVATKCGKIRVEIGRRTIVDLLLLYH